ncbi:MAG: hypothetical protein IPG60_01600 [Bacteroidetes bacterium]|nr:hypothetical protein [Bacteroidota bacterium]MBP8916740.1 hypothetical protein [Chitinophagales bacterium]MBP9705579.1 hypothetical protein [Chitinophagales bacterium]
MNPSKFSPSPHYPFGMLTPGRNWSAGSGGDYGWGFGGHEKIDEVQGTGNVVDMGDRWLLTRLGRTPKPDSKAKKYPGISPYTYALNSPLIVIDPDGKVIKIITQDPEFRGYILNQLQKLTDEELSIDANGVIQIVHSAENPSKSFGTSLINQLVTSENTHFILQSTIGDNYSRPLIGGEEAASDGRGIGTTIVIDPNSNVMVTDQDDVDRINPKLIVLGHELIHSSHADNGEQEPELADPEGDNYPVKFGSGIPLTKEEIKTREKENILRKEQGVTNLRKVSGPNKASELPAIEITPEDDKK